MAEFLAMGGHGFFIWTSYLFFVIGLLVVHIVPFLRRRQLLNQLRLVNRVTADTK